MIDSISALLSVADMDANNIFQMFFGGGAPGGADFGFGGGWKDALSAKATPKGRLPLSILSFSTSLLVFYYNFW